MWPIHAFAEHPSEKETSARNGTIWTADFDPPEEASAVSSSSEIAPAMALLDRVIAHLHRHAVPHSKLIRLALVGEPDVDVEPLDLPPPIFDYAAAIARHVHPLVVAESAWSRDGAPASLLTIGRDSKPRLTRVLSGALSGVRVTRHKHVLDVALFAVTMTLRSTQPERVRQVHGIVSDVRVEVNPTVDANGVFTDESAESGVVVASSVVVGVYLGIPLSTSEGVAACRAALDRIAPGIVLPGQRHRGRRARGLGDASEVVGEIVADDACLIPHGEGSVDAEPLDKVVRLPAREPLLDDVRIVVDVRMGDTPCDLLGSSALPVIGEAGKRAGTLFHRSQAVFRVPLKGPRSVPREVPVRVVCVGRRGPGLAHLIGVRAHVPARVRGRYRDVRGARAHLSLRGKAVVGRDLSRLALHSHGRRLAESPTEEDSPSRLPRGELVEVAVRGPRDRVIQLLRAAVPGTVVGVAEAARHGEWRRPRDRGRQELVCR